MPYKSVWNQFFVMATPFGALRRPGGALLLSMGYYSQTFQLISGCEKARLSSDNSSSPASEKEPVKDSGLSTICKRRFFNCLSMRITDDGSKRLESYQSSNPISLSGRTSTVKG